MLDSEGTVKHLDDMVLWQVELNTIAASFGGVASKMLSLHRHVLRSAGLHHLIDLMPDNNPIAGIADAIICARKLYKNPQALVLLVCHEFERNVFDQNCLHYILQERDVPFVRKTFAELDQQARLDDKRSLYIGQKEVAVVYYRTGYDPQQYDEVAWRVRRILERSLAACCPDIPTQLAGTKKVQQKLTSPDELSSLGLSGTCIARLQQTFTTIHGLDEGEEGDMAVQKALANPDQYVLKPQREGGGNNLYDEDMVRVLTSGRDGERGMDRAAYILMHRFRPPSSRNVVICPGAPCHVQPCVSELGVFGSYVRCGTEMILNNCCGHLLRSKSLALKDGGVMAGNAALNNPCLVPMSAQPLLKL
uniref:glutathione synthetase-like isoform X1 n=1 Tax=Myxine glutinosa TaxID=7769 RepID=UPI00358F37FD